jgi:protocatechuate 3,4-dioxygenase beta subunit
MMDTQGHLGTQPDNDTPSYRSTQARHPALAAVRVPGVAGWGSAPLFPPAAFAPLADLTRARGSVAIGERIVVAGQVSDERGRPVAHSMVEVWQANAAGRYDHARDQHEAPLDPAFEGAGRVFTDADGGYRFVTIKPGAYPWANHANAWRPNHIHFSLFGPGYANRLITQMYFPGDPLLELDPIYNSIPDAAARARLVARFELALTQPDYALGYRFDIVLRGAEQTPFDAQDGASL